MSNHLTLRITRLLQAAAARQKVTIVTFADMGEENRDLANVVLIGGTQRSRDAIMEKLRKIDVGPQVAPNTTTIEAKPLGPLGNEAPSRWVTCSRCKTAFEVRWNDTRQRCECGGNAR